MLELDQAENIVRMAKTGLRLLQLLLTHFQEPADETACLERLFLAGINRSSHLRNILAYIKMSLNKGTHFIGLFEELRTYKYQTESANMHQT